MDQEIYVPMSRRAERALEQLVSLTELPEERIIEMAFTNLLACLRQYENDNFPDAALPPEALSLSSCSGEGEPAGL
jgi:hypothetical protein